MTSPQQSREPTTFQSTPSPGSSKNRRASFLSGTPLALEVLSLGQDNDSILLEEQIQESRIDTPASKTKIVTSQSKLEALRAGLVRENCVNVSACTFTPLFTSPVNLGSAARQTRSYSLSIESVLDWFIPNDIHQLYMDGANTILLRKRQALKQQTPKGSTISSRYKPLTWPEYWRYWGTHLMSCLSGAKSTQAFYQQATETQRQLFVSKERFRYLRASMIPKDLDLLGERFSYVWCAKMMRPKIVCVDESLWKFLASFLGDNASMVAYVPRKPAKVGVMSFEACCFCHKTRLPYVLSISPRLFDPLSPGMALEKCLTAIRNHCTGGSLPLVVADSAYSSESILKWMSENSFPFVVSGNTGWHSTMHEVCAADLELYSFRCIADSRDWIHTAYRTAYLETGSTARKRGERRGWCSARACRAIVPRPPAGEAALPSASAPQSDSTTDAPSGSDIDLEVARLQTVMANALVHHPEPVLFRMAATLTQSSIDPDSTLSDLILLITGVRPSPPGISSGLGANSCSTTSSSRMRKARKVRPDVETFVKLTPYESIKVGERIIGRTEILEMSAPNLKILFSQAFPRAAQPKSKDDSIMQLWDVSSLQNNPVLAAQLVPFGRLGDSTQAPGRLQSSLPFLYAYREHFASIDRLDQFLSYLDPNIKVKDAQARIAERMFMCGVSNARTWFLEEMERSSRVKTKKHEFRPASRWAQEVANIFFTRASINND